MVREQGNTEKCVRNCITAANCARKFLPGHGSFLGPGSEKKWYGTYSDKPDGCWDKTAERMMLNFAESGPLVFRTSSGLKRGELKSKGEGVKTVHFNGSEESIELISRTITSVKQLSI